MRKVMALLLALACMASTPAALAQEELPALTLESFCAGYDEAARALGAPTIGALPEVKTEEELPYAFFPTNNVNIRVNLLADGRTVRSVAISKLIYDDFAEQAAGVMAVYALALYATGAVEDLDAAVPVFNRLGIRDVTFFTHNASGEVDAETYGEDDITVRCKIHGGGVTLSIILPEQEKEQE